MAAFVFHRTLTSACKKTTRFSLEVGVHIRSEAIPNDQ